MEQIYKFELNNYKNNYFMPYISELEVFINYDKDIIKSCIDLIEDSFNSKCIQFNYPCNLYIIEKDNIVVSVIFVGPYSDSNSSFNIHNVCTHKKYRKRGYITALMRTAIDDIGSNNDFYLESEPKNLCIYNKLFDIFDFNDNYYTLKYKK